MYKVIGAFTIITLLCSCIVSSRVSTIGQRFYMLKGLDRETESDYIVNIEEYEAEIPNKSAGAVPYTHEMTLGPLVGKKFGYINKAKLDKSRGNATVIVKIDNVDHVFVVPNAKPNEMELNNAVMAGKKWYFLPSQGLQILAIPCDITIDALLMVLYSGVTIPLH